MDCSGTFGGGHGGNFGVASGGLTPFGVNDRVPVVFINSGKRINIPRILPEDQRKCFTRGRDIGKYGAIATGVAALIAFLGMSILGGVASPVGVPFTAVMITLGAVGAFLALLAAICLVVYGVFHKKLYL